MWVLKGGMALEFRFGDRARTTRDVDLESDKDEETIVGFVVGATEVPIDDFFSFVVERTGPIIVEGVHRAIRFRITGLLSSRRFETVIMDVGLADRRTEEVDLVTGSEFLKFAGLQPLQIQALPLTQHLAEKLHAYTRVYAAGRLSSRVKDLVDIVLIVTGREFKAGEVCSRIEATFGGRDTHTVVDRIPEPPEEWRLPYREMATQVGLDPDANAGYSIAAAFFDPLLAGDLQTNAQWSPESHTWLSDIG